MLISFLWPEIEDEKSAKSLIMRGLVTSFILVTGLVLQLTLLALNMSDPIFEPPGIEEFFFPVIYPTLALIASYFLLKHHSLIASLALLTLAFLMGLSIWGVIAVICSITSVRAALKLKKLTSSKRML